MTIRGWLVFGVPLALVMGSAYFMVRRAPSAPGYGSETTAAPIATAADHLHRSAARVVTQTPGLVPFWTFGEPAGRPRLSIGTKEDPSFSATTAPPPTG
jgi:hypothetical protein